MVPSQTRRTFHIGLGGASRSLKKWPCGNQKKPFSDTKHFVSSLREKPYSYI